MTLPTNEQVERERLAVIRRISNGCPSAGSGNICLSCPAEVDKLREAQHAATLASLLPEGEVLEAAAQLLWKALCPAGAQWSELTLRTRETHRNAIRLISSLLLADKEREAADPDVPPPAEALDFEAARKSARVGPHGEEDERITEHHLNAQHRAALARVRETALREVRERVVDGGNPELIRDYIDSQLEVR